MKQRARQLRQTLLMALLLLVGCLLAISSFTLWRLRTDAVANGLELAAVHSRNFEDLLTQSLHVTGLVAANTLAQSSGLSDPSRFAKLFVLTLSRAPFLRSMSLLDDQGRIVASSNPANLGITVTTGSYLPPASGALDITRIGRPWAGRDFADGRESTAQTPVEAEAQSFIPVTQTLTVGDRTLTLLVALNPDYFINHMSQTFDADQGWAEILRYDGVLLMSTDPTQAPGSLHDNAVREQLQANVEFGQFESAHSHGQNTLTAFRASRLYPLVVITHIRHDFALRHWEAEARALFSVILPVLLLVLLLAFAFYRRQMQLAAQAAEALRHQRINATVFESSTEAILITDLNTAIISINPAFTRVTGYLPDDVIGRPLFELLTQKGIATFNETMLPQDAAPGADQNTSADVPASIEVQQRCKDGRLIWIEVLSTPEQDTTGRILGYHRICRNITERKQMQDQVKQLAFHDPLTQLPNRRLLSDRLDQAMAGSKRNACYAALMFLDLDNFKPLNDTYGHEVGDLLLIEAGQRLRSCVRGMDTVARFGGDEFVVMLSALNTDKAESIEQARLVAEKIRVTLSQPYVLPIRHDGETGEAITHQCTASIGVVVFINHEISTDTIFKWADAAMYRAKACGRNSIRFHYPEAEHGPK